MRTLNIIVPSTGDRVVGFEESCRVCEEDTFHAVHLLFLSPLHPPPPLPYSFMYTSTCTTDTEPTSVEDPLGERYCSTVFDIREELLEERWPPVVVAPGREKRAPGPDLSSVSMRGSARYRSAKTRPIVSSGVMSRVSRL